METRVCTFCGVKCLHNPMKKAGEFRCTFCGLPPNGNGDSLKRKYQAELGAKQQARAFMRKAAHA